MPKRTDRAHHMILRLGISVLVLLFGAYVILSNWHVVRQSVDVAGGAHILWLTLSLVVMAFTFFIAAAIYGILAQHRLRYRATLLVEVATAFVNRLLPSGVGGLGLHGLYLYKQKHTGAEATVVVSVNNLIGILAHLLLLTGVLAFRPSLVDKFIAGRHLLDWRIGVLVAIALGVLAAVPRVRTKLLTFTEHMLTSVHKIRLTRVAIALLLAMALTMAYTLILCVAVWSLDVRLSILQVFIVFSLGMLTSTATPTPGGLVGAEAGLFAGFVAYGVSSPVAGAVVLLYRLVTYWMPLIPGLIALLSARRQKLV